MAFFIWDEINYFELTDFKGKNTKISVIFMWHCQASLIWYFHETKLHNFIFLPSVFLDLNNVKRGVTPVCLIEIKAVIVLSIIMMSIQAVFIGSNIGIVERNHELMCY